jgi:glycosyltransferase involved in cell wall biosynthesis
MKVYLNRLPKTGPWGGGIKTVNKLVESLKSKGHDVVFSLHYTDIDVIFCIDPRPNHLGEWYQNFLDYKLNFPAVKIVQRLGDLGTHSKPELTQLVRQTLNFSDHFIFPSEWAHEWIGFQKENKNIVHNAPMPIFHKSKRENFSPSKRLRVVTHHWSMNPKKGFDFYQKLEDHCNLTNEFEFTYIGRLPDHVKIKNHILPLDAMLLAKQLPEHDVYLTASIEEAGANHVLEAMASGLPVVYRANGGSIENYCESYGERFENFEELLSQLRHISSNYRKYKERVLSYENVNDRVVDKYIEIMERINVIK